MSKERSDIEELLRRIREHQEAAASLKGGRTVGGAVPSDEELECIRRARAERDAQQFVVQMEQDLTRRLTEYEETIRLAGGEENGALSIVAAAAEVDARIELLAPLRTLFRVVLLQNRLERRVNTLEHFLRRDGPSQPSMALSGKALPVCVMRLPNVSVPTEVSVQTTGQTQSYTRQPRQRAQEHFANYASFEVRAIRRPFEFKEKQYSQGPFLEFPLNTSAATTAELQVYYREQQQLPASGTSSLSGYHPSANTLEQYVRSTVCYNVEEGLPYGQATYVASQPLLSLSQGVTGGIVGGSVPAPTGLLPAGSGVVEGLSNMPVRMHAAATEDSLSDSDSETDRGGVVWRPETSWLPQAM